MERIILSAMVFCFSLFAAAAGVDAAQQQVPGVVAGFMEQHINQMKQERPIKYQQLLATARQPVVDCASCHIEARSIKKENQTGGTP